MLKADRTGLRRLESNSSNVKSLRRMNSKVSVLSRRRAAMKSRVEGIENKVEGAEMNIQKLLEDVRVMKNKEYSFDIDIKQLREDLENHLLDSNEIVDNQNETMMNVEKIEIEHQEMIGVTQKAKNYTKAIQKSINKSINSFKVEYKRGFNKIINCEIALNHLK